MDQPTVLDAALLRPESFLEGLSDSATVILDEAQKAPRLFDAIKARVDIDARPGQYLLLGSTEFSKGMKIRESLTGRISRLRLFPLILAEIHSLADAKVGPFFLSATPRTTRRDFLRMLERGGMPGIFATRSDAERNSQTQDWIALTVERDALQIPTKKINPAILRRLLREIAVHPEPEAGRLAKSLRISSVTVKSMIDVLKTLFAIHEIQPHPAGTGKPRYYLCDPGIAAWLGAGFERQIETCFYLHQLAMLSYCGLDSKTEFSYYRTAKGSVIHGVWEEDGKTALLKLLPTESIDERELLVLKAARDRAFPKATLLALAGIQHPERVAEVQVRPWEAMG